MGPDDIKALCCGVCSLRSLFIPFVTHGMVRAGRGLKTRPVPPLPRSQLGLSPVQPGLGHFLHFGGFLLKIGAESCLNILALRDLGAFSCRCFPCWVKDAKIKARAFPRLLDFWENEEFQSFNSEKYSERF